MCVGVGLKIGQVTSGFPVPDMMEFNAFVNLLSQAFFGSAVSGMERPVITISTPSGSYCSVTVWTGEPCVNHHFLESCSVFLYEITGK